MFEGDVEMEREKAVSTYIKNGKEMIRKKLSYNLFGKQKIYERANEGVDYLELAIKKDIELLHLKNFIFGNTKIYIQCLNEDTLLILDHCRFARDLNLTGGNIILDCPQFEGYRLHVNLCNNNDIELVLEDNKGLSNQTVHYDFENVKNVVITGNGSHSIVNNCGFMENIHIKDTKELSLFSISAKKMQITNSTILTGSTLALSNLSIQDSEIITSRARLGLYDPRVTMASSCSDIKIRNSVIKGEKLSMPDGVYTLGDKKLVFSDDSLGSGNIAVARTNLISCLKTLGADAENICKEKTVNIKRNVMKYYDGVTIPLLEEIESATTKREYYETLISSNWEAIEEMENTMAEAIETRGKTLKKQKIREVIPTKSKRS